MINEAGEQAAKGAHLEGESKEVMPAGEDEMEVFVHEFEQASSKEKPHEQMLSLKKIRLHHKVLSKISFNAYKFVIEFAQVIKV